jgi:hypothetical protein
VTRGSLTRYNEERPRNGPDIKGAPRRLLSVNVSILAELAAAGVSNRCIASSVHRFVDSFHIPRPNMHIAGPRGVQRGAGICTRGR